LNSQLKAGLASWDVRALSECTTWHNWGLHWVSNDLLSLVLILLAERLVITAWLGGSLTESGCWSSGWGSSWVSDDSLSLVLVLLAKWLFEIIAWRGVSLSKSGSWGFGTGSWCHGWVGENLLSLVLILLA